MSKYYRTLCSCCSHPMHPEMRDMIEEGDHVICTNCRQIMVIRESAPGSKYKYLEVERHGTL